MSADILEISESIREYVSTQQHIVAVYLFGSVATKKMRTSSDLDIAMMTTCRIGGFERIEIETELSGLLHKDVDLVIFHQAEVLLQHQILKYGFLLCEKNASERVKQETISRREYLDTRFLFKELTV